jgi:hypothetical protein
VLSSIYTFPVIFKCNNIVYQINENSRNPGYFAINIVYVGGTYDVSVVEIWQVLQYYYLCGLIYSKIKYILAYM